MVTENASCTTDSISCCSNKSGSRRASLSTLVSSEYRVVCGYIRGYLWTDGVKDGRVSASNENITKEQGIDVLLPEVKRR
jgi:hypothetical protein